MSESTKYYLASALVCAIVWGAILGYGWARNQDAVKVSTVGMSQEQIQLLKGWFE